MTARRVLYCLKSQGYGYNNFFKLQFLILEIQNDRFAWQSHRIPSTFGFIFLKVLSFIKCCAYSAQPTKVLIVVEKKAGIVKLGNQRTQSNDFKSLKLYEFEKVVES